MTLNSPPILGLLCLLGAACAEQDRGRPERHPNPLQASLPTPAVSTWVRLAAGLLKSNSSPPNPVMMRFCTALALRAALPSLRPVPSASLCEVGQGAGRRRGSWSSGVLGRGRNEPGGLTLRASREWGWGHRAGGSETQPGTSPSKWGPSWLEG